jgi:hypothetical protein
MRVRVAIVAAAWLAAEPARAETPTAATAPPITPAPAPMRILRLLGPPSGGSDSPAGCRAMGEALSDYASARPITEMDVYAGMGDGYYAMAIATLSAITPYVGGRVERGSGAPALVLSWSATLPFGPVTACRVARFSHSLDQFRSLRVVLEPGIIIGRELSVFARPALRAIWHRSSWRVGIGAGLGSTLLWVEGRRGAASISPELLGHIGRCCHPGFFTVSLRGDVYFPRREPDSLSALVGLTFW